LDACILSRVIVTRVRDYWWFQRSTYKCYIPEGWLRYKRIR